MPLKMPTIPPLPTFLGRVPTSASTEVVPAPTAEVMPLESRKTVFSFDDMILAAVKAAKENSDVVAVLDLIAQAIPPADLQKLSELQETEDPEAYKNGVMEVLSRTDLTGVAQSALLIAMTDVSFQIRISNVKMVSIGLNPVAGAANLVAQAGQAAGRFLPPRK